MTTVLVRRNYAARLPSMRIQVSPEEWEARVTLVAAYPWWTPTAYDLSYNHITASSLVKIDRAGTILQSAT